MRYVTLCSGIGAMERAADKMSWAPVANAEIDPFSSAVLAHHWPSTPNLGDVSKIDDGTLKTLGNVDLIMYGTPCQDFSVAGRREGLNGERSGLFHAAVGISHWLRQRAGLRWVVFENVPGLFSSNEGRDFSEVVGSFVGTQFDVPRNGWQSAGAVVGPHGLAEWRVLDGKSWGPPQSRRRVFIVVDFEDWESRRPILLESEGVPRDLAASGETRTDVAGSFTGGFGNGGPDDNAGQAGHLVATSMTAREGKGPDSDCTTTLVTNTITADYGRGSDRGDFCKPMVTFSPYAGATQDVSYPEEKIQSFTTTHAQAFEDRGSIRKLTPREVSRCFGFPDTHLESVTYRGKCPPADAPRYRALGNSIIVPVLEWIADRLSACGH